MGIARPIYDCDVCDVCHLCHVCVTFVTFSRLYFGAFSNWTVWTVCISMPRHPNFKSSQIQYDIDTRTQIPNPKSQNARSCCESISQSCSRGLPLSHSSSFRLQFTLFLDPCHVCATLERHSAASCWFVSGGYR